MLRKIAASLVLAGLAGLAGAPAHAQETAAVAGPAVAWALRLPQQEPVLFRGVVNFDGAGQGTSTMMYPAPGLAGLVAAIATHGVLLNASRDKQKSDIELEADKVLLPYQGVLGAYKQRELMTLALVRSNSSGERKLIDYLDHNESGWIVESTPLFSMTQDQSALVLENTVSVYKPGALRQASYQNIVRVVSQPSAQADLSAYWNAADGRQLKEETASLLALSVDIALQQAILAGATAAVTVIPFQTVRYAEGKKVMMERAQLLSQHCGRSLIRTLRGSLMSVPAARRASDTQAPDEAGCAALPQPAAATL